MACFIEWPDCPYGVVPRLFPNFPGEYCAGCSVDLESLNLTKEQAQTLIDDMQLPLVIRDDAPVKTNPKKGVNNNDSNE